MSTESVASGSGGTAAASEEAPFSTEQLAWIDRLIAARHSAPTDSPDATGSSSPPTSSSNSGKSLPLG